MSDAQNAILTKLGFDSSDLKAGLDQAKAVLNQYKLDASQADAQLAAARVQFAQSFSDTDRRLAQQRLAAAQQEVQQKLAAFSKLDAAEKASAATRISILNQTISAQRTYLQNFDTESQKIQVLTAQYQNLAAQARLANTQKNIVQQAGGGDDYRFTLNRVLAGITPGAAAGVVGAVAGGTLLAELPAILKSVAEGFKEAVTQGAEFAETLENTAQKTGIAVPELQKLYIVAATDNTSLEGLTRGVKQLSSGITGQDVVDESGNISAGSGAKARGALNALGIDAAGKDVNQVLGEVADKFKQLPDGATKVTLAVQLFGKAGQELIPLLNEGSDGFKTLGESVDNFDFDTSAAHKNINEYQADQAKLKLAEAELSASFSSLLVTLGDYLSKVADTINYFVNGKRLDAGLTGVNRAGAFNLTNEGVEKAQTIVDLSNQTKHTSLLGAGQVQTNLAIDAANDQVKAGAESFRKRFKLSDSYAVDPSQAAAQYVKDLGKAYVDTSEAAKTANEEEVKRKLALEANAKALQELEKERVKIDRSDSDSTRKFQAQTSSNAGKQFGAAFQIESGSARLESNQRAADSIRAALPGITNKEDLEYQGDQLKKLDEERLQINQKILDLDLQRRKEALESGLKDAKNQAEASLGIATSGGKFLAGVGGYGSAPIIAGIPGGGLLPATSSLGGSVAGPSRAGGFEGDAKNLQVRLDALKATGQNVNTVLQQEIDIRRNEHDALEQEINGLLAQGTLTDEQRARLTTLTTALDSNNKQLASFNEQLNGITWEKVTDGLASLTEGIAEFGDTANQTVKAVTRGFDTITKNNKFFQGLGKGTASDGEQSIFTGKDANGDDVSVADRVQGAGKLAGGIVGGIGELKQGGASALTGGISLGSQIGGLFGPLGGLVGTAVGAVGGGIAAIFGGSQKKTDKIAKDVQDQVKGITDAISAGTTNLVQGLAQLQAERVQAVSQLSGKKGGADQLKQITDGIDQQVAQLKVQQKAILDKFNQSIGELQAPQGTSGYVNTIAQIAQQLKDAADAGATAAQQTQFLNLSLNQLKQTVGSDLQSAEQNTISLLQKEVDLKQQSADIDSAAAEQALGVQRGLGLARGATAGQTAAQQLRDIENQRQKQQADNATQQKTLQAQIGQQAQLFGINLAGLTLEQQKALLLNDQLTIQQAITAETVAQIANQQAFYAGLASGNVSVPAGVLPPGLQIPTGSGYTLGSGGPTANPISIGGNVPITIQYSGPADPKQLAEAVRTGLQTIVTQRSSGKS